MSTLLDYLSEYVDSDLVSFHMPGHKGARFFKAHGYSDVLDRLVDMDITEIDGADNLYKPESVIKQMMDDYAQLYDVLATYLLVGGSSAGIIAAIMAAVNSYTHRQSINGSLDTHGMKRDFVSQLERNILDNPRDNPMIVMARNSHKSVYNAVRLCNATPMYLYPETLESGVSGGIAPQPVRELLQELSANHVAAVVIPSPNYYGICSDIKAIADICHEYGTLLIVDEAHGAHLKFMNEPLAAEANGADIVIMSTHKTLATFTSTALLHICSARVNRYAVEDALQMIQTTSPSYMMLASFAMCAEIIKQNKQKLFMDWAENLDWFYNRSHYNQSQHMDGLEILDVPMLDRTKMNISLKPIGISGAELEKLLIEHGIIPELVSGDYVMCMTGIGNVKQDYVKLYDAILDIICQNQKKSSLNNLSAMPQTMMGGVTVSAIVACDEDDVHCCVGGRLDNRVNRSIDDASIGFEWISLEYAMNRKSGAMIIPYPPGIPIIVQSEIFTKEVILEIQRYLDMGTKVLGIRENHVLVSEI
ncbi:MAG: aminotransferase class V-fold PLP-dependent enzyme [Clostridiales Family XIII bacterium]|jgi:lysine decarboxylase|nr:aminotransferase class V-fold PLP-dependent enzyme [Clostridiales Family XIII bacterium]